MLPWENSLGLEDATPTWPSVSPASFCLACYLLTTQDQASLPGQRLPTPALSLRLLRKHGLYQGFYHGLLFEEHGSKGAAGEVEQLQATCYLPNMALVVLYTDELM